VRDLGPQAVTGFRLAVHKLVMISDIMHIVAHDKGKLAVRRGRKTTGPPAGQRGYRSEQGLQVYNKV